MASHESLVGNSAWNLIGAMVYAGCNWAAVAFLTRWADPASLGEYVLATAFVAPVVQFGNMQLRTVYVVEANSHEHLRDYLALRFATAFLVVTVAIVVGFAGSSVNPLVLVGVAIARSADSVGDLVLGFHHRDGDFARASIDQSRRSVLAIALFAVGLAFFDDVASACFGLAIGQVLGLLLFEGAYLIRAAGQSAKPSRRAIIRLCRRALPMGIVMLLLALEANAPRYLIGHLVGTEMVGVFVATAYLPSMLSLIFTSATRAGSPGLARAFQDGRFRHFNALLLKLAGLALLLGLSGAAGSLVLGDTILRLMYGTAFSGDGILLTVLFLAMAAELLSSAIGCGLTATGVFTQQVPIGLASMAVVFTSGGILLSRTGDVHWIALAIGLAALVRFAFLAASLWNAIRNRHARNPASQGMPHPGREP